MYSMQKTIDIILKGMDYQRNGVSGIGFYTVVFDCEDGKDFIATFETFEDDLNIKIESCRVVNPKNPLVGWRGDNFGDSINKLLFAIRSTNKKQMIYDCMEIINKK